MEPKRSTSVVLVQRRMAKVDYDRSFPLKRSLKFFDSSLWISVELYHYVEARPVVRYPFVNCGVVSLTVDPFKEALRRIPRLAVYVHVKVESNCIYWSWGSNFFLCA